DRNRKLLALRQNDPGDLHRTTAGGTRPAARRRAGERYPGAHQPPDAAGRETKVCGFRHRYIRGKGRYRAADPGRLRRITENSIMRVLRTFFWAALLAAGFVYITGGTRWDVGGVLRPVRNAGRVWSEPTTAESAGFSTDEQNNIDIYKSARDATVFITSKVYTRTFFGIYPETGTGSGFVISPEGEILTNNHVAGGGQQLTVTLSDKKVYKARVL